MNQTQVQRTFDLGTLFPLLRVVILLVVVVVVVVVWFRTGEPEGIFLSDPVPDETCFFDLTVTDDLVFPELSSNDDAFLSLSPNSCSYNTVSLIDSLLARLLFATCEKQIER